MDLGPDPIQEFGRWFAAARAAGAPQPEAIALATTGGGGQPTVRMVLLKGWDARGFTFFTNTESRKGADLSENPRAAFTVYWSATSRQVRVTGRVSRVPAAESDAYWATRPRGSQLAAWASAQSHAVASRAELEGRVARVAAINGEGPVPRPPFWGGYLLRPATIEFWQHRDDRLHDRLSYRRARTGWRTEILSP
ncbi:MAG: pyridoxamine 5'-phosphate oxidase [Candidatus Dormibacteraceae bacterium]